MFVLMTVLMFINITLLKINFGKMIARVSLATPSCGRVYVLLAFAYPRGTMQSDPVSTMSLYSIVLHNQFIVNRLYGRY